MKRYEGLFSISLIVVLLILAAQDAVPAPKSYFLLPGLMLERLPLEEGAGVAYLVVTESFDVEDSTEVSIEIKREERGCAEVSIVTSQIPRDEEGVVSVKIRFAKGIESVGSADELRSAIDEILVKTGKEPYRHPTDEEMREFGLDDMFFERSPELEETVLDSEIVSTTAGTFKCSVVRYTKTKKKVVDLGGISAESVEELTATMWKSSDVPVFGLVKTRIETKRQTIPRGSKAFPLSKPRVTTTEAILISRKTKY